MHDVINPRYLKIIAGVLLLLFLFGLFFSEFVVNFFLSYLLLYKYTTLFIIVFLAGFCVPIPMNILLTAIGALTIKGDFNIVLALMISITANLIGDMAAVLIFRKYGHAILRDRYVEKYPFFLRLEKFFQAHTNISIFISRIIGIFGTPVNFLSGYLKISLLRFAIVDVIGNFVFASFFLSLGYMVGDKWLAVSDFVNTILSIFAVIIFSFLLSILFYNKKPSH
ncbi:MAG TPA: VTT domain-containing protein [Candidatus Paceibacterota bacterium]